VDKKAVAVVLIIAALSSALVGYFMLVPTPEQHPKPQYSVDPHSRIAIAVEGDLTRLGAGSGCECVRTGSGRQNDPYLISDWILNSTGADAIIVAGTTVYITIARVKLLGANFTNNGIYIYFAQNVIVEESQIQGYLNGIFTFSSSNLAFINNTVTENFYGIQLEASNENKVVHNTFDDNREIGIFVRGSRNTIVNNSASHNWYGGINVDGTAGPADENLLDGNVVSGNRVYGIGMWHAIKNVLRSNTVTHNEMWGIMLTDHCAFNVLEANTVLENDGSGISLIDNSSKNTIRGNTSKGNGDGINGFDLYDAVSGNDWQNNTYDTKKPESLD
jgi:parallel beta-helix repeat protein